MKRIVGGWALGAFLASFALLVARTAAPGRRALELDVYLIALAAIALLAVLAWLVDAVPSEKRSLLEDEVDREPEDPPRIVELDRLERELAMGVTRAFDLHYRLRPVVREIAAARLERRGLRLDSGADAVRKALGEDVWELVRADRDPPANRLAAGIGIGPLREVVEQLERV